MGKNKLLKNEGCYSWIKTAINLLIVNACQKFHSLQKNILHFTPQHQHHVVGPESSMMYVT